MLTLTGAVCQLDVDNGSCLHCAKSAVTKLDVWVNVLDRDSVTTTACFSDCCSQLWIMSRLLRTSGDGRTPEPAADTTALASFVLEFVRLPSSGCSRANSVTEQQPHIKIHCTDDWLIDWVRLNVPPTHYRSYRGRVYTGQMTQPTVSKHLRNTHFCVCSLSA